MSELTELVRSRAIETGEHVIAETPEDYIDCFLSKMKEEEGDPTSIYTEETLVYNVADLWSAGQDTTSTTMLSGLTNLLNQPEVRIMTFFDLV